MAIGSTATFIPTIGLKGCVVFDNLGLNQEHRDGLRFAILVPWSAPLPRLTMLKDFAQCARLGFIGGAGRNLPLRLGSR
jgi:hypothetical protein